MSFSEYISCPDIALLHLNETVARATQYYTYLPSPQQPKHSLDSFNELVDELEAAYDLYVEEAFEKEYDEFLNDEDALIHRPDDDPTDLPEESEWYCPDCEHESNTQYVVYQFLSDDKFDEPACGDCGGCCECLGDPEVEDRFDTLHEQEEFYRETDAMFI